MKVSDLFRRLSLSELSGLSLSNEGDGTIVEAKKATIIEHANDGLLRLYSRFLLKQEEVLIEQLSWLHEYTIDSKHGVFAEGRPESVPGYILDKPNRPYRDDLIKILKVIGPCGELPLNEQVCGAVATPLANVLQIGNPVAGQVLSIIYQAQHVMLTTDDDDVIALPRMLLPALYAFISSKIFSNMNGAENIAKGMEQESKFEMICAEAVDMDLMSSSISNSENNKLDRNGWR